MEFRGRTSLDSAHAPSPPCAARARCGAAARGPRSRSRPGGPGTARALRGFGARSMWQFTGTFASRLIRR
eukprot:9503295-Pyramimonas_sp.AAC.1